MVNQRLIELGQPIEEQFKILLIPTRNQDMDRLERSIINYSKSRGGLYLYSDHKTLFSCMEHNELL